MILKQERYDDAHRIVTTWVPNIASATRRYSEEHRGDVLDLTFQNGDASVIKIEPGTANYLCNDTGKTMDVLSRLDKSKEVR